MRCPRCRGVMLAEYADEVDQRIGIENVAVCIACGNVTGVPVPRPLPRVDPRVSLDQHGRMVPPLAEPSVVPATTPLRDLCGAGRHLIAEVGRDQRGYCRGCKSERDKARYRARRAAS